MLTLQARVRAEAVKLLTFFTMSMPLVTLPNTTCSQTTTPSVQTFPTAETDSQKHRVPRT